MSGGGESSTTVSYRLAGNFGMDKKQITFRHTQYT